MFAAGLQAPYTNIGVNYMLGGIWQPYAGFNTLGRVVGPRRGAGPLSCGSPLTLTSVAGSTIQYNGGPVTVDPATIVRGSTCANLTPPAPPP